MTIEHLDPLGLSATPCLLNPNTTQLPTSLHRGTLVQCYSSFWHRLVCYPYIFFMITCLMLVWYTFVYYRNASKSLQVPGHPAGPGGKEIKITLGHLVHPGHPTPR